MRCYIIANEQGGNMLQSQRTRMQMDVMKIQSQSNMKLTIINSKLHRLEKKLLLCAQAEYEKCLENSKYRED